MSDVATIPIWMLIAIFAWLSGCCKTAGDVEHDAKRLFGGIPAYIASAASFAIMIYWCWEAIP